MNDSREFQEIESTCSGKLPLVRRQSAAVVSSIRTMPSRVQSLRHDTWNLFGTSGNVFDSRRAVINSSLLELKCYVEEKFERQESFWEVRSTAV